MPNPLHVVKKPIITEKATREADESNRHAFLVDRAASKTQIKAAIEELYSVHVERVSTQIRKGRLRRFRHGYVQESPTKKAVVTLRQGDAIELF